MELPSFCYVFDTFERFVLLSIHVKSEIFFEFKDLKYFENSVEPVDFESTDCELADTEVNTDIGVEILVTCSSNKVDISSDVWQLGLVYLPHLPHQHLADQSEESIIPNQPILREYYLTGSKLCLPCVVVRLQFNTDLFMGISILTFSTVLPMVCLGPTATTNQR